MLNRKTDYRLDSKDKTTKERFHLDLTSGKIEKRQFISEKKPTQFNTWYYLGFIGEIGFTIAIPIVGGALLGLYIDKRLSIYPKATLSLLLIGVIISIYTFIRTILDVLKTKK